MEKIQRMPFFRLLIPLITGICLQYFFFIHKWSIILLLAGGLIMFFSYLIPQKNQFNLRWIFGVGLFSFLVGIGILSTQIRQSLSSFNLSEIHESYEGTIIDIPQEKPNTIAYKVQLHNPDKKIVCYLSKDSLQNTLRIGDSFIFFSQIRPFKNRGNDDKFDYAHYMYNKGYSGFAFVPSYRWEKSETSKSSLIIKAGQYRQKILDFYKSLNLNDEEYAILSALTLGYKDALSDDLKQSFQATGTAHILAVSGMHVGIIFLIIFSSLSFIPKYSRYFWMRYVLAIIFLWIYTFIVGLPPSAIRASIMLTLFCIAGIKRVKGYSFNTLFATAFLMLVWNPLQLFDLGFQLSFMAVLSMLLIVPLFSFILIKNKCARYFWNILIISLAAQIGTAPLTLYYFGTFPTYFFIANLLIIPLVGLIIYSAITLCIMGVFGIFIPSITNYLLYIPISFYKIFTNSLTVITQFFEKLPFAQLQDISLSLPGLFLLWMTISAFIFFIVYKKPKALIMSLSSCLVLIILTNYTKIENRNSLNIYNNPNETKISLQAGWKQTEIRDNTKNLIINLSGKNYFILSEDKWKDQSSNNKFDIDYLHIVNNNSISLYSLQQKFDIQKVILDSSLSPNTLKRLTQECEKLRIPYYDVSENGLLRIFFN
ncbi:MAG: ComEC/Rec2 family competence protein [Dysgonomonas sp.]|nr:ComEC/Rec2 family competence protein [Dysgonomonas sp.]